MMDLRVTIKFLKENPHTGPAVRLRSTLTVFEHEDPRYCTDNPFETILCLIVPEMTEQILQFQLAAPVRRVVLGNNDLAFETTRDSLTITLPPLSKHTDRTADMHMIVPFEGVDLRVEVPNELQANGKYSTDDFPNKARQAATVLEFALLEAVQRLGLDQTIGQGPCGPIYIMGFDTNNPCGHTDWPPHVHLHMARPSLGAPIGHYYFDDNLRVSHNAMYARGSGVPKDTFREGEHCPHLAPDGSVLFDLMITQDGGFELADADGRTVRIAALSDGFDRGARVLAGEGTTIIKADLKIGTGEVVMTRDGAATGYLYDQDTGQFLSFSNNTQKRDPAKVLA